MKLPSVQFTVRRLMVAVAAVGVFMSAVTLIRRRASFLEQAGSHELSADVLLGAFEVAEAEERAGIRGPSEVFPSADQLRKMASWHEELWRKYERAARCPWLPVAPDTPYPK